MIFGAQHQEETRRDVNVYSYAHLTLILLLHYHVECRSPALAVYDSEFIPASAWRRLI